MKVQGYLIWLSVGILLTAVVSADIIHLKDGTQIEGTVRHADDGWTVWTHNGKLLHVARDNLASIELTGNANAGPVAAAEKLGSLRRSIAAVNDLNEIVARFQRFVDTCTDPAALAEGKKDLAVWQDRVKQKMVKVGDAWVLPSERQKLIDRAAQSAEQARQLVKQGRTREATVLLNQTLAVDPQNAAALYLCGFLQYQQDQVPQSRKSFEAVAELVPNHAPTLNNLAITQWRSRQYIAALLSYDAAMLAAPVNRAILDNVASAMLALPAELQKSPVTAKVLRHFQQQDAQLGQRMGQSGLRRYGAVWVSDRDMAQMHEQEKVIQNQLDQLAGDFDRTKAGIGQLDQNISDDQSQIRRIEATSVIGEAQTGIPIQIPYPQLYYDLGNDVKKLQQARAAAVTKLDSIKRQADTLQRNRPSEKFSGSQQMIGPEGTPLQRPPPATAPG